MGGRLFQLFIVSASFSYEADPEKKDKLEQKMKCPSSRFWVPRI